MTRELLEGELTWADKALVNILADAERWEDVIKDISTDAIRDVVRKLDVTSDEFRTGADILGERAYSYLYQAADEVLDETYEELFPVITTLAPPPRGVDDEVDTSLFDANARMTDILLNAAQDIAERADTIRDSNDSILDQIGSWLSDFADDLHSTLWGWIPELTNDAAIYLAALPAKLLFEAFKDFFFEED